MSNTNKQINLLQRRITYLKEFRKMLDRNASFRDVVDLIVNNEEVSDRQLFVKELNKLMEDQVDQTMVESLVNA